MHDQRTMNQYVEGLSPACWCERHGPEKSTFVRVRAEGLDGYEIRCFKCETLKGKGCAPIVFNGQDDTINWRPNWWRSRIRTPSSPAPSAQIDSLRTAGYMGGM